MRQITKDAIKAFLTGTEFKRGNTEVERVDSPDVWGGRPQWILLKLHGNVIAAFDYKGKLKISSNGHKTNTTRERLNGLPGVHIVQEKGEWYLNGELWDGEPTQIEHHTYPVRNINPTGAAIVRRPWE